MLLKDFLTASIDGLAFDSHRFLQKWFDEHGQNYFFLFRKNLSVTNIQVAELLSLIREHATCSDSSCKLSETYFFHTRQQFSKQLQDVVEALVRPEHGGVRCANRVAEMYGDLIRHSIVIEPFYCSCVVSVPPNVTLPLEAICGSSGYIHSCGIKVFAEPFATSEESSFFPALRAHFARIRQSLNGKKIRFIPYTHEDFTPTDRQSRSLSDALERGLDGVKLRISKLAMGEKPLAHILREMGKLFEDELILTREKDKPDIAYHENRTIWLIKDYGVNSQDTMRPGDDQFYICFDQLLHNSSPFFEFDEDKPAWRTHTTTPHTLTAAMINVTLRKRRETRLLDPFAGTFTTFFEALRHENIIATGIDDEAICQIIAADNALFFALPNDKLGEVIKTFSASVEMAAQLGTEFDYAKGSDGISAIQSRFSNPTEPEKNFFLAWRLAEQVLGESKGSLLIDGTSRPVVKALSELGFDSRLQFYTMLRGINRFAISIGWGSTTQQQAYLQGAADLVERFKRMQSELNRAYRNPTPVAAAPQLIKYAGRYSDTIRISPARLHKGRDILSGESKVMRVGKADAIEGSFDVIICDPPYGFNTEEDLEDLAKLYVRTIPALVKAVCPGGALLICLPRQYYTGRNIPFCVDRGLVISQVLAAADVHKKKVVIPAAALPHGVFSRPYYWSADKSLSRWVLHFEFSG